MPPCSCSTRHHHPPHPHHQQQQPGAPARRQQLTPCCCVALSAAAATLLMLLPETNRCRWVGSIRASNRWCALGPLCTRSSFQTVQTQAAECSYCIERTTAPGWSRGGLLLLRTVGPQAASPAPSCSSRRFCASMMVAALTVQTDATATGCGGIVLQLWRNPCCGLVRKKRLLFLSFPYVCPEPVLVE
jgi:hypothetical protein